MKLRQPNAIEPDILKKLRMIKSFTESHGVGTARTRAELHE